MFVRAAAEEALASTCSIFSSVIRKLICAPANPTFYTNWDGQWYTMHRGIYVMVC